jgi:hypothetical protein
MNTLAMPKQLALLNPGLHADVKGAGTDWSITIQAEHPALWTWVQVADPDARYSDNFVHIEPGVPARITVRLTQPVEKPEFIAGLKVRSLYDTYTTP